MASRRYRFDEKKLQRFRKEGRGNGNGQNYKPWLTVQDVSSLGRATRIPGNTTGRLHHLLSDLETDLFLLLDWDDSVLDIREQFPLRRDVTRILANEMAIPHPIDPQSRTDIVMTTDFLIDVRVGETLRTVARSVKPSEMLANRRTLEKLELERRYWKRQDIEWHLVTEKDLPRRRVGNLQWLHKMRSLNDLEAPHPDYWTDRCDQFLAAFARAQGGTLQDFIVHLKDKYEFSPAEPLTVLRHLVATKRLTMDLDRLFSTKDPLTLLEIADRPNDTKRFG